MKISLNWLRDFIELDESPEQLAEQLTMLGLEVEGVHQHDSIPGGLKGVVVGEVLECEDHPNADRLVLTRVDVGEDQPLSIVCGAPNVAVGQKVLVARVGATIHPLEGEPFEIKRAKIRGEESEGMICAEDELSLGDSHEGILVLPEDAPVGRPAAEYYELESDTIIDIDLTPNRSDATHHLGVARDLAAYRTLRNEDHIRIQWPETDVDWSVDEPKDFSIDIRDEDACPRYGGVLLDHIQVGPSPQWIQNRLKAIDIKPKNNVVDITNYVLHEMGQPLHAFDAAEIEGNGIVVRKLEQGTRFTTLDGEERTLTSEDLMICDAQERPLCIAGVFGGIDAEVDEETDSIFLESAHFDATGIRRTSMHHLLRTDAAKIFEKGSDPSVVQIALERAVSLLQEYAGAEIASDRLDHYPDPIEPARVDLQTDKVEQLLGIELEREQLQELLSALNMDIVEEDGDTFTIEVPTDKSDVSREVDVIEEILRIYGYDQIPQSGTIQHPPVYSRTPSVHGVRNALADELKARGFNEMMNLSLDEGARYPEDREDLIGVLNTSNRELNVMRPDLIGSGLQAIQHNQNRQQKDLRLFEFGRGYLKKDDTYEETEYLNIWLCGRKHPEHWQAPDDASFNFYALKAQVHALLHRCGVYGFQEESIEESENWSYGLYYHRGPKPVAAFGRLSKAVCDRYDVSGPVFGAQIYWKAMYESASAQSITFTPMSRYPTVERDLALVLDEAVSYASVERQIRRASGDWLKSVELFDSYRNEEQLGANKKSYAVRMTFENPEKTLSDEEVNREMNRVIERLEEELDASLR